MFLLEIIKIKFSFFKNAHLKIQDEKLKLKEIGSLEAIRVKVLMLVSFRNIYGFREALARTKLKMFVLN